MGVATSEVGYTSAMPRREEHEVHKDMSWHSVGGEGDTHSEVGLICLNSSAGQATVEAERDVSLWNRGI